MNDGQLQASIYPVNVFQSRNLECHLDMRHHGAVRSSLITGRYQVSCLDNFDDLRKLDCRGFDIDVLEEDLWLKEDKANIFIGDPFDLEYSSGIYGFSVTLRGMCYHVTDDIVDYVQNTEAFYANMQRG